MLKRILTSIVALIVLAVVLISPPVVFTIALALVILVMLYECYCATGADKATSTVGFISGIIMMAAAMIDVTLVIAAIAVTVLIYMGLVVFKHGEKDYKEILSNGFLTIYIVLSMGCVWYAKELYGMLTMLMIFICAWVCDTFAYFTGSFIGRHKLIPHVSPKKTIEGSIGGIIGSVLVCGAYALAIDKSIANVVIFAIFGLVGSICSQIGDLSASAIKRDAGIKDFGWIFPGHGGFMDRFDSVMYIAPILHIIMIIATVI